MTGLFGWLAPGGADAAVAHGMACALQAHPAEAWAVHTIDELAIGVLDGVDAPRVAEWATPAWSADRRHALWLAGEVFELPGMELAAPHEGAAGPARAAILARLVAEGSRWLCDLDGEYQMAWWDRFSHTLRLFTDRFSGLPLYFSTTAGGFAFACGVRGVLMAPGMSTAPDVEAIREAVTTGGYRLGARTNVVGVSMAPGAADITVEKDTASVRRYWTWSDLGEPEERDADAAVDQLHDRWRRSVARRLRGTSRPGQTLSGGLDSRLILAEASPRARRWTAITFGVPGCDDARVARRVAGAFPVDWQFVPLYQGDWLARRSAYIQQTDGLIDLGDLVHLETLPLQREVMDVHVSGYIGDAVAGSTFGLVRTREDALVSMPYYETPLGLGWDAALDRLTAATVESSWLTTRFALFEHKLPQAVNRWSAAWRPWLRVRRPFIDYQFFDYCQTCTTELRVGQHVYERWLRRRYPAAFARIPNQKTGAPAGAGPVGLARARAGRVMKRAWRRAASGLGMPLAPWSRGFLNDEAEWSRPGVSDRIRSVILRPGSVAVDTWGRDRVMAVLDDYLERRQGPTQVVGALYTFESYHQDLSAHLGDARRRAPGVNSSEAPPPSSC